MKNKPKLNFIQNGDGEGVLPKSDERFDIYKLSGQGNNEMRENLLSKKIAEDDGSAECGRYRRVKVKAGTVAVDTG